MARHSRLGIRFLLTIGLLLTLAGTLAGSVLAVEFRSGGIVTIGRDEVINDDLFVSGDRVNVDGTVNGDLWVAGGRVEVNGTVNGSLFFAARLLNLNGRVTGSIYGAGSATTLGPQSRVGRNVYFVGAGLASRAGSVVQRDLLMAGSQAQIDGQVARDMSFGGNALVINGTVGRNVQAAVAAPGTQTFTPPFVGRDAPDPLPAGLRVSPGARIGGTLTYSSPVEQSANIQSQPAGGVVFRQSPQQPTEPTLPTGPTGVERWALGWFRFFVTLLALSALAIWGFGAPIGALADKVRMKPLLSLAWGILILLAGFFAAFVASVLIFLITLLLALLTLGELALAVFFGAGSALAFGFIVFLLTVAYGSKIVVAYLLGDLVLRGLARQRNVARIWVLLVGVLIYSLLQSIPFVGGWIGLAAILFGLGAIYLVFRDSQSRPAPAP